MAFTSTFEYFEARNFSTEFGSMVVITFQITFRTEKHDNDIFFIF